MKKYLIEILLISLITVGLTGCYTMLWTPDQNYPTENTNNQEDTFYPAEYYGDYSSYYATPWWLTIAPPYQYNSNQQYNKNGRSQSTTLIRNSNGERGSVPRTVLDTPPPARVEPANTTSSGSNNSNNSNSSNNSNGSRVESTNSGNNSASRSGNSNNNSLRNNNGSRNTNGRR